MRGRVCVGVTVHAEPHRLTDTLHYLRAHTDPPVTVVVLPDGPDDETAFALATAPGLTGLDQWGSAERRGTAAAFNRLAAGSTADVVVLLESGALVGPRWLEFLLGALDRPGCGLAGPSTNRAGNEQACFPGAAGDERSIRRDAALAARRFGFAARSLEPRHTLADFCYAVRREVLDDIGPAPEAYGPAPGWERDVNAHAARAGWRGLWVGAAYVYRSAPTARRGDDEVRLSPHANRLYQDRLCGLRLRGVADGYREYCVGDDCEHFAPSDVLARPPIRGSAPAPALADRPPATTHAAEAAPAGGRAEPPENAPRPVTPEVVVEVAARRTGPTRDRTPLVSCIMPTRDRPDFAAQAVQYFRRQDYPDAELVIIEDGPPRLEALLPADPRVRVVCGGDVAARSIGALRNLGCEHARGEIIVHWDDDDWHGPHRVSRQVAAIRAGEADITALRDTPVLDLTTWRYWRLNPALHRRLFVRDVHGGTLAFRRAVWERLARFPDRSLAEDAAFLDHAVRRGARLVPLDAGDDYVYVRHETNSWRLETGGAGGWREVTEPTAMAADRDFYRRRAPSAPGATPRAGGLRPLVSCIMPTFQRRAFVPFAIEYFRRQDYPATELVVLDDGPDPVRDLVPDEPGFVYRRLDQRLVLGAKRNVACRLAGGELIAHWDDDDWHAPHRLSTQVAALSSSGHDICGARSLRFYDPIAGRGWAYRWPATGRIWAAGASLCYRRDLWRRSPFPEVATGEDTRFVWSTAVRSLADVSDADCVVAIIHNRNTVPKSVRGVHWTALPSGEIERLLGSDLAKYRGVV